MSVFLTTPLTQSTRSWPANLGAKKTTILYLIKLLSAEQVRHTNVNARIPFSMGKLLPVLTPVICELVNNLEIITPGEVGPNVIQYLLRF